MQVQLKKLSLTQFWAEGEFVYNLKIIILSKRLAVSRNARYLRCKRAENTWKMVHMSYQMLLWYQNRRFTIRNRLGRL